MNISKWLGVGLFLLAMPLIVQSSEAITPEKALKEAQDYIIVKPSHSYQLLFQPHDISALQPSLQLQWQLTKMRAAIATNNVQQGLVLITELFALREHSVFKQEVREAFRLSGIVLRKMGYLQQAHYSYRCALNFTEKESDRVGLLINRAVLARHLEQYQQARAFYLEAERVAKRYDNQRALAAIYNNLGSLQLDLGDLKGAEQYYRQALGGFQETDKRSGNITAGTNLLLIFAINNDTVNFQRLLGPTETYVRHHPDLAKKALMTWLKATDWHNQGKYISDSKKTELVAAYHQLDSIKLKQLVAQHLASRLAIELRVPSSPELVTLPQAPWFAELKKCFAIA